MRVIKNERTVFFDVDKTLILPNPDRDVNSISIIDPYDNNKLANRLVHKPHLKLLTNYLARGFEVFVWSKNGYRWAVEVLRAVGLENTNIFVLTKPCVYVDDELSVKWMGEHVYIPHDDSFGQE